MSHPSEACPNCGYTFTYSEMSRLEWYGRRRVVPCSECSTPLIWEERWFRVYVAGIWTTIAGIVFGVASLLDTRIQQPLGAISALGMIGGAIAFGLGGRWSRLVKSRE